ncbi:MAG TPA: DUF924 family protein [Coxiellaceae bacterium]|nr:DUF924 family protein [Coxiellaceae bacterium]
MTQREHNYEDILTFWFGRVEETIVPTEHRARVWFSDDVTVDQEIQHRFKADYDAVIAGERESWKKTPRGQLALIIVLDQFSRHLYRDSDKAFSQDKKALKICLKGLAEETDHHLSLIERVFYYFPLLHSEAIKNQELSLRSYSTLGELAFSETRVIFDSFLKFAHHHYSIIEQFGRFPQRNEVLQRESTMAERQFQKEIDVRDVD